MGTLYSLGFSKQSPLFRVVALLNLVTYIFFRIFVLGWMTWWIFLHRYDVPPTDFPAAFTVFTNVTGVATIDAINIINFYKLIISDFYKVLGEDGTAAMDRAKKK